ncbi:hypothetical protein ITJ38_01360 [Agreia pratensis]|uniref:hypothetical protein n=1 Tax=Agreia pratensis TaxID=150121 RepID=UPI00188A10C1|nr:hypothetical protein [Agreia pratensis]MBF4633045.1 hypothetical protein [Agreia pratensis]
MEPSALAASIAIIAAAWTSLALVVGLAFGATVRRRDAEAAISRAARTQRF